MPTYDYRCERGHTFELFHGIKDETPRVCPECGAAARRVPAGGGGLLFRGSGFYITDHRSDSYRKGAKAEGSSGPASGGSKSGGAGDSGGGGAKGGGAGGSGGGGAKGGGSGGPAPSSA